MKICIYCGNEKEDAVFSDEHIWPAALGGDFLDTFWRTDDVCSDCNSMSGVFVDGAFIKGWMGAAERSIGWDKYLSLENPARGILPLHFIGTLSDISVNDSEVVDFWVGPCGANIIHIRPKETTMQWSTYVGGDPRLKKSRAGRVYLALTSDDPFWVIVSLASFKAHFKKAKRYVVNMDIPDNWTDSFRNPDLGDVAQALDMVAVNKILTVTKKGKSLKAEIVIDISYSSRFLAKVALAIGYKVFGEHFLCTEYAQVLRKGFREANFKKRNNIPIRGSSFFNHDTMSELGQVLSWEGGWVLFLTVVEDKLSFNVTTPSGKNMTVMVCDDVSLVTQLDKRYRDGLLWLVIPALGRSVNEISLPEFLAHQLETQQHPKLTVLAAMCGDPSKLPPCKS